ncbi:hypothetical protein [Mycobacterium kubicae]|uniref:5'-methylthioadenosine/S-adenosylhomocysteine nucleosidase family protein n=1 Tax=Mycobacterium kubicae TaxID=120959 RepID=UPI0009EDAA19|nr:hypothetical protein [Mycobacterium kubicae]
MTAAPHRRQRTLVLSAFPAETDALLARTTLDPDPVVIHDRKHFYLGSVAGKDVIVAMTGIGLVNAVRTTETALRRFPRSSSTPICAVLFSGVAGGAGRTSVGDVAIPARWTLDNGASFICADPAMLAAAQTLVVDLASVGNRQPRLFVGGDGYSNDHNNGQEFPCIPRGGSVFGCQPARAPDRSLFYSGNFFRAVGPWLHKGLLSNLGIVTAQNPAFDAVDQETAAAQAVALAHGVPFLGIRGMSDGPGDPLHLPGFPFQFFFYKKLAADNAARVTEAFLKSWVGA